MVRLIWALLLGCALPRIDAFASMSESTVSIADMCTDLVQFAQANCTSTGTTTNDASQCTEALADAYDADGDMMFDQSEGNKFLADVPGEDAVAAVDTEGCVATQVEALVNAARRSLSAREAFALGCLSSARNLAYCHYWANYWVHIYSTMCFDNWLHMPAGTSAASTLLRCYAEYSV